MLHEIVEAVHSVERIKAATISSHTNMWKASSEDMPKVFHVELMLTLKPRVLVTRKRRRVLPISGEFLEIVGKRLNSDGWKTRRASKDSLTVKKKEDEYAIEVKPRCQIKVTGLWGMQRPKLDHLDLEKHLEALLRANA